MRKQMDNFHKIAVSPEDCRRDHHRVEKNRFIVVHLVRTPASATGAA